MTDTNDIQYGASYGIESLGALLERAEVLVYSSGEWDSYGVSFIAFKDTRELNIWLGDVKNIKDINPLYVVSRLRIREVIKFDKVISWRVEE